MSAIILTKELVRSLFNYNSDDGILIWKISPSDKVKSGDVAGRISNGYLQTGLKGKKYYNHRIMFLFHHGYLPEFIDHIDGNRLNNKINNLRECTWQQNHFNRKIQKNNTSGVKGVSWNKPAKKWLARITFKMKVYNLGFFEDIKNAEIAVRKKRLKLHGEFANNG